MTDRVWQREAQNNSKWRDGERWREDNEHRKSS